MEMSDSRSINSKRADVWVGITSAETLEICIPGCKEMTGSLEEGFTALVVQKIGPMKAKFHADVTVTDIVAGESCTLIGEGKGGAAGFAKGEAKVQLSDGEDGMTILTYEVQAKIGGKLAQLGSRLIDGVASKLANQFFETFQQQFDDDNPDSDEPTEIT